MPKSLALGNGNILILLDQYGQVKDFYFPYVGLENHIAHFIHRIGVWVDNQMHWFGNESWKIEVNYEKETLSSNINAINENLKLKINFKDVVYNEKNIFIRRVTLYNLADKKRRIKVYFNHEFEMYESHRGDTAYYEPTTKYIIHYKGRRVFLINALNNKQGFEDFSIGLFNMEGKEGTYKDAEDGELAKNPIEHGTVDSTIGLYFDLEPGDQETFYYWVIASRLIKEVKELNDYILDKTPQHLIKTTEDYWYAWANKQNFNFYDLHESIVQLFKKSLFLIRTHVDNNGAIIASGDSDMLQHGRDTYSYMWPRDGAFCALALDQVGDLNVAKRFFEFCNDVITNEGYLMHKYRPDRSLGSSWHPWVRDGKPTLPIQEDETALVIYALWKHYENSKDLEFIENIYNSLIKKAADFMMSHIEEATGLLKPSYDLWEEKFGTSTFTASAVFAALRAAAQFAQVLGKTESNEIYGKTAEKVRNAILSYLYDNERGIFYKSINFSNEKIIYDSTVDMSSFYGIFKFQILDIADEKVQKFAQIVADKLACKTKVLGFARYENDQYYKAGENIPGNPWFLTTLWYNQYLISKARNTDELKEAERWLLWVVKYAQKSGILSEQLNPYTGEQISAAPLTWSHSEFVVTVISYIKKLELFNKNKA